MTTRPTRVRLVLRRAALAVAGLARRPRVRHLVVVAARCPFCRAAVVLRAPETIVHAVLGTPVSCPRCPGTMSVRADVRVCAHVPPLSLLGFEPPRDPLSILVGDASIVPIVYECPDEPD